MGPKLPSQAGSQIRRQRLAPGVHRIRAQMDWCSSDDLDVEIGIASECAIEVEFPFSAVLRVFSDRPKGTIKIRKVN